MKWHNPGLGEVHNEDHSQMIYCEDVDGIVDDVLAKEVCDMLNSRVKPAVEPVAWRLKDKERSLELGFDVYVYYGKSDFKPGIDPCELVDRLERLYTAPAPNALDAETAIKNCLEAGETIRVLKRVMNLLLESRSNLGPEDHELRDRIDQLFSPDAAIAAQSAQGAKP